MIEVTGVNKMFGEIKALDNIVATIQEGSIFGLIGTNGAGNRLKDCNHFILVSVRQCIKGNHDRCNAGQKIRKIGLSVFFQICQCYLRIKESFHASSLPAVIRVSVSEIFCSISLCPDIPR